MAVCVRFRSDGSFTIVQFTDLHYSNGDADDVRTLDLMNMVLDVERPDLVVLTGDLLEGKRCVDPAGSFGLIVEPMESRGIRFASVFGNHDDEGPLTRQELLAVERRYSMSMAPSRVSCAGDYVIPVSGVGDGDPAAALYLIDSGSYAPAEVGGYAWITAEQIEWYREMSASLLVPSLVFFHIPFPEFNDVWDRGGCRGEKHEAVCCPKVNSGFFGALCRSSARAVFVGHDHINDYEGVLGGIRLCYGRATGYGTYGRAGFARGARVIRLSEGSSDVESWIRLEDGTVIMRR